MKRIFTSFLLMIFLYLLQTTMFSHIAIAGIKPNIIIPLVVLIGYKYGRTSGMIMGFFVGLLFDFIEGDYIGYYTMIYLLMGYFVGFCNKLYNNDSTLIPLGLIASSDFVLNFFVFVTRFLLRNRLDLTYYFVRIILPELIYTVVVAIFLYKPMDYLYMRIENLKKKEGA